MKERRKGNGSAWCKADTYTETETEDKAACLVRRYPFNGGYFYYAHLSCYSNIKKGAVVKAGTLLGYMGNTGYGSIGTEGKFDVHLHFGIYIKTDNYEELSVNPYYILKYLENCILYANY